MKAVENLAPSCGVQPACEALDVPRASYYRSRRLTADDTTRSKGRPQPDRALSDEERQEVLAVLHSEAFVDKPPAEIYAALLDQGRYLCSVRTMYRILLAEHETRERRNQLRHPQYRKPELLATAPNQVWSWDITKLLGPAKWTYFYLFVILDIFSRYVVGWMLASRESSQLAQRLIRESIEKQGVWPDQLVIHSDRGPSMKSHGVAQLLATLGVTKSHSRPHVSNDNPFSESQFKTLKYHPEFPDRFGSQQDAHAFCQNFFRWYNDEHYHCGIAMLTPAMVHHGAAGKILRERQLVLDAAYRAHPERFVKGRPSPLELPRQVWINPPENPPAPQNENQPLVETGPAFQPCASKAELEISLLTSAEPSGRPRIPPDFTSSLNSASSDGQEEVVIPQAVTATSRKGKRLPETNGPQKPEAPLAHPRPGYPSSGCVPAEPDSVSPDDDKPNQSIVPPQAPLDTRAMPPKIPGVWGLAPSEAETTRSTEGALH